VKPDLITAIISLVPNAKVSVVGLDNDATIIWKEEPNNKPTEVQIRTELARLQAEFESNEYQRLRQYPSLGDQLDMLWHAIDNGTLNKTSDFYTAIKAVKDAHPKE